MRMVYRWNDERKRDNTEEYGQRELFQCHFVHHKSYLDCAAIEVDLRGKRLLTLRLLMSYIYMEHLFLMFLDHTQRRSTVGRTPLDE